MAADNSSVIHQVVEITKDQRNLPYPRIHITRSHSFPDYILATFGTNPDLMQLSSWNIDPRAWPIGLFFNFSSLRVIFRVRNSHSATADEMSC